MLIQKRLYPQITHEKLRIHLQVQIFLSVLIRLAFDLINIHNLTHLLTYLTYNILGIYHNVQQVAVVSSLHGVLGT